MENKKLQTIKQSLNGSVECFCCADCEETEKVNIEVVISCEDV